MKKIIWLVPLVLLLFSCGKNELMTKPESSEYSFEKNSPSKLNLHFSGLQYLGPHFRYEGWIMVNGVPLTTGKFNITPGGQMSPHVFNVSSSDLQNATAFVLTLEPQPDSDPGPSATKILAGDFNGNSAALMTSHGAALGNDFLSATGKFLLATPTTASTDDEESGIWFIDNSSGSGMAGFNLPVLPSGWKYEGWSVINSIPLTTGTFISPNMSDEGSPFSGTLPEPPFPGEDFIVNAPAPLTFPTDLSGTGVVLTIEPSPDNSPDPFTLKPLVGMVPVGAAVHTTYSIGNNASSFPTGTASR